MEEEISLVGIVMEEINLVDITLEGETSQVDITLEEETGLDIALVTTAFKGKLVVIDRLVVRDKLVIKSLGMFVMDIIDHILTIGDIHHPWDTTITRKARIYFRDECFQLICFNKLIQTNHSLNYSQVMMTL